MTKRIGSVLMLISVFATPVPAAERFTGHFGLSHDSNPANASNGAPRRADFLMEGSYGYQDSRPLDARSLLVWRLAADAETYVEHDRLSLLRASGLLRYAWRAGDEFHSPLLAAWASLGFIESASHIRSGHEWRAGIEAEQRLTTRVNARLGAQAAIRNSRSSAVFDLEHYSATLGLGWHLAESWKASLAYRWLDGGLVTTVPSGSRQPAGPFAMDEDDAFAAGALAFRLRSHGTVVTLGINRRLSPHLALDAQLQWIDAQARSGIGYGRELANISLLFLL